MTDLEIRLAVPEDAAGLANVHIGSWQAAYVGIVPQAHLDGLSFESRTRRWEENLSGAALRTYVAVVNARIIGFVSVGASRDGDLGPDDAEVPAIYLLPSYWRQAVGTALWRTATNDAERNGARTVSAWVLAENDAARGFYESVGCVDRGARKNLEIGGKDLLVARYTQTLEPSDR